MARTASISIIKNKDYPCTRQLGFTLVELMIASVLSAIVFAAIFSAYIYMARNLTRIANFQQQQVQNRQVLYVMSKDVNEAVSVSTPLSASLSLTLPPRPPSPDTTVINYIYDSGTHALTRVAQTGALPPSSTVLLANLTAFTFAYFDESGGASPPAVFIKQIEITYSSAVGDRPNGTQSGDRVVSSRMVLRSKPPLGQ